MLHKFESQLYPFDLYVTSDNEVPLKNWDGNKIEIDLTVNGQCWKVKSPRFENGILIWINPNLTGVEQLKIIVHEVIHALGYAYDIIGEDLTGNEPDAYLAMWMFECVYNSE